MRIQKLLEAGNISFDVHGANDMEKEDSNLKEMIMELKPKSGATVKEFSSPVDDTERTNDLEMVISGTYTVTSGDEEASDKHELQLDFSSNKIVAIIGKVDGAKGNT